MKNFNDLEFKARQKIGTVNSINWARILAQIVYYFTAAAALGAPRWKVIVMVALRAVKGGVLTGILLAIARISGETAPLLFTALNNQFWTSNLGEPMASLPVTIFKFAMSPYENWQQLAWAGVFLITLAVLGLNILARVVTRSKV